MSFNKVLALLLSAYLTGLPIHVSAAEFHQSTKPAPYTHITTTSLKGHYSPGYLKLNKDKFAVTTTQAEGYTVYSMQPYTSTSKNQQIKLKKLTISPSVSGSTFVEYLAVTESGHHIVTVERTPPLSRHANTAYPQQQAYSIPLNIKKSIMASGSVTYTTPMPDHSTVKVTYSPSGRSHSNFNNKTANISGNSTNGKEPTKNVHPDKYSKTTLIYSGLGVVSLLALITFSLYNLSRPDPDSNKDPESAKTNPKKQESRQETEETESLLTNMQPSDPVDGGSCQTVSVQPNTRNSLLPPTADSSAIEMDKFVNKITNLIDSITPGIDAIAIATILSEFEEYERDLAETKL
ncbi:hypothetical protein [Endozoicomonas lisbonensis]|uniref:Uncharacterized protein n=1 Tax=Endozoicomonas lisbonensis TaxID=3120522 RepID=A0ABV2SHL7_9GAMM